MFAAVGAAAFQLIPLPRFLLQLIAPASDAVAQVRLLVDPGGALPLSIDPYRSAKAILLVAGAFLLFVTARAIFDAGGVRTATRLIAVTGLVLSSVALAQDATAHGLMYWRWKPLDEGPDPFGPFVNRNHFATWAMMAVPLSVGYLIAHASARQGPAALANWRRKLIAAVDARASLLLASASLLIVAVAASLSRSGLIGLGAALACGWLLAFRRGNTSRAHSRARVFVVALAVVAVAAVLTRVGPTAITERFGASRVAVADRLMIWHDTLPVLRDFWLTGTGVGTFLTSMGVYQRSSPGIIFNQAHNHYLQVAAEGGLLVGLPVLLAILAFVRAAWRRLQDDRSGMYWVRAGAVSGLCGVAVQSLWETGLTVPANAAMAAVLAAIAIHAGRPAPEAR
jgi:O-antigen ligase